MKWIKNVSIAVAACMATVGAATAATAALVEKPSVLPDAMITATVSDLHGLIDGVGSVAEQVSPMASGMMLKSMIGMQLGDPGLAGIAPGKGLAVVALDQTNLFAVVEVNEAQAATYSALLSQKGLQSRLVDGVLIVAPDAAQLEKGAGRVAVVKETLLARRSPTLRIAVPPAALYEKNKLQVDGMMQMMPMMLGMGMMQAPGMDPAMAGSTTKILQAEVSFLLSLAKQCEAVEVVVAPQDGAVRISETLTAKPATRLATLLTSPKSCQPNPKLHSGLLGDAAIAVDCTLSNPDALASFVGEELELLLKDMNLDAEMLTKVKESMTKWMGLYGGTCCETIGFGGDSFMHINYALEVKDEAAVMSYFKTVEQDMAPFLELYKSMGMPMTFEFLENAREHKGVPIHQFKVGITMPEDQQAAMKSMNMDMDNLVYDFAICDGFLLYAMGGTTIETLIDRVKDAEFQGSPLMARSIYPTGGFYYCDVDVAKYMEGISSIMPNDPNNPLPQISAMLQGAEPVTSAGFREDGMVMWSVNVPGSLLAKVGQAAMMIQMQQMQQMQQAAPLATPSLDPVSLDSMPEGPAPVPAE